MGLCGATLCSEWHPAVMARRYLGSEQQCAEGENRGQFDDGEQELVCFQDTLRLLLDSPLPLAVFALPLKDGHQCRGNKEQHAPIKQEICTAWTDHMVVVV